MQFVYKILISVLRFGQLRVYTKSPIDKKISFDLASNNSKTVEISAVDRAIQRRRSVKFSGPSASQLGGERRWNGPMTKFSENHKNLNFKSRFFSVTLTSKFVITKFRRIFLGTFRQFLALF
jgi:hypothetical protein